MDRREEIDLMSEIANHALKLYSSYGISDDKLTVMMDLEHAHADCPLNLEQLHAAAISEYPMHYTFTHDILGIRRHMNRQTGQLEDCFVPRTAANQGA